MNNFEEITKTPKDLAWALRNKECKCAWCSKFYEMTEEEIKNEKCDLRACHLYIKKWLESDTKE